MVAGSMGSTHVPLMNNLGASVYGMDVSTTEDSPSVESDGPFVYWGVKSVSKRSRHVGNSGVRHRPTGGYFMGSFI